MQHSIPNPLSDVKTLNLSCPPVHQQKKDSGETARSYTRKGNVQSNEISDYEYSELPVQQSMKQNTNWNSVSNPNTANCPREPYHYSESHMVQDFSAMIFRPGSVKQTVKWLVPGQKNRPEESEQFTFTMPERGLGWYGKE